MVLLFVMKRLFNVYLVRYKTVWYVRMAQFACCAPEILFQIWVQLRRHVSRVLPIIFHWTTNVLDVWQKDPGVSLVIIQDWMLIAPFVKSQQWLIQLRWDALIAGKLRHVVLTAMIRILAQTASIRISLVQLESVIYAKPALKCSKIFVSSQLDVKILSQITPNVLSVLLNITLYFMRKADCVYVKLATNWQR